MSRINKDIFVGDYTSSYAGATPFPHIVLKDLWDPEFISNVSAEVKGFEAFDGEKEFYGATKKRYCGTYDKLPPSVRELIDVAHSDEFLKMLEKMTGEENLVSDPYLEGGGIHRILPGGFLKVHADFNFHRRLNLYRRLNILIYLNPDWDEAWGGDLQLWNTDMSGCAAKVYPSLNTTAIFTTDDQSFHGHPDALKSPRHITRDSIALYYYSNKRPQDEARQVRDTTDYRARGSGDLKMKLAQASESLKALVPGRK